MNPLLAIGGLSVAATGLLGGAQIAQGNVPDVMQERHEKRAAVHEAVEAGDYAAWEALVPENAEIRNVITEDNFDQLQALHELREAGDKDAAKILRDELGLPEKPNHRRGHNGMNKEAREAMHEAIESGDFAAWQDALPEKKAEKIGDVITAENFDQLVKMHELREAGEYEAAAEIREALGLPEKPERPSFRQAGERELDDDRFEHRFEREDDYEDDDEDDEYDDYEDDEDRLRSRRQFRGFRGR